MKAGKRVLAIAVLTLSVGVAASVPAGAADESAATSASAKRTSCSLPNGGRGLGTNYVTSLKVRNTSCSKGVKLVEAYHKCRKANGGADGRCGSVNGYKCEEKREVGSSAYIGKAKCKKGEKKVVQTYQQNI